MTEREINERRNWKAEVFPYDYYIPDDTKECQYCLTEKQAEILRGIVVPLAWRTRWWTNEDVPIDRDKIEAFRDDLIRRLMMSCCGDDGDTLKRMTPEGKWQISTDNGSTWVDDTATDPRRTVPLKPTYPSPEGDTPLCEWADSVTTVFKTQFVDVLDNSGDLQSVFTALAAILALILASAGVAAILVGLAAIPAAIFALGISAFKDAMTSDVWNRFRCNVFNHMDANGIGTQEQIDGIYDQIATDETGIARLFLQNFVALLGVQGMANAANFGLGNPDANCCPSCATENWAVKIYNGNPIGVELSRGDDFIEVQASLHPDFGQYVAQIQSDGDDTCCSVNEIEVISGTVDGYFYNACGDSRWPDTSLAAIPDLPRGGNTFHCRNTSAPFTVKFHFGD